MDQTLRWSVRSSVNLLSLSSSSQVEQGTNVGYLPGHLAPMPTFEAAP